MAMEVILMIRIQHGNAVEAFAQGTIAVLGHQVNCDGVMGAGIARQIAQRWPTVLATYRTALQNGSLTLGQTQFVRVGPRQWIANIAGQRHPTRSGRATDYAALAQGLTQFADFLRHHAVSGGLPYGIGCGLAGGDWAVVEPLITQAFSSSNLFLTLFRWP